MLGLTRLGTLQLSRLLTERMNEREEILAIRNDDTYSIIPQTHLKNPFPAPNKNFFSADQSSEAKNQPPQFLKPNPQLRDWKW